MLSDFLLAVGSNSHKKVEKFQFDRMRWTSLGEYPFLNQSVSYAPIIYFQTAFYIIGGYSDYADQKMIARMDLDGHWTQVGELNQAKSGHNVIYDGEYLIVVGGGSYQFTEKCTIKNESVTCTSQNPELASYYLYPELFLVTENYCKIQ